MKLNAFFNCLVALAVFSPLVSNAVEATEYSHVCSHGNYDNNIAELPEVFISVYVDKEKKFFPMIKFLLQGEVGVVSGGDWSVREFTYVVPDLSSGESFKISAGTALSNLADPISRHSQISKMKLLIASKNLICEENSEYQVR